MNFYAIRYKLHESIRLLMCWLLISLGRMLLSESKGTSHLLLNRSDSDDKMSAVGFAYTPTFVF